MSSGDSETSSLETDVPKMVGVTRVSVLTQIDDSRNSTEQLGVLDILDSVRRDRFDRIGVASSGNGNLLTVLRE